MLMFVNIMNDDFEIEDSSLNEDFEYDQVLRPKLFSDFEGQDKIVDNLKVFIQAAKQREEALDHVLISALRDLVKQH